MLSVDQSIFNKIAKTQKVKNPTLRALFNASQTEIAELEEKVMNHIEKAINRMDSDQEKWRIALIVYDLLPLYLEERAITRFILQNQIIELRGALPEILSPEEALLLIARERPYLTEKDKNLITEILNHPNKYLPKL